MARIKREQWTSKLGFIWAAVGSAIGLGSIWRFPYVVGENGGALFIFLYLICLVLIGFPILVSEILIGKKTQLNASSSFLKIGKNKAWQGVGTLTIITGFLVSSFYAVVAGWTLGYFFKALSGSLTHLKTSKEVANHFYAFSASPYSEIGYLLGFIILSLGILYFGVQKGIEAANKVIMPLLLFILIALATKGLFMSGGKEAFNFLFKLDFKALTPQVVLLALGQAFFSLSLGQGTMVTYGSYLSKKENVFKICLPVTFFGIVIALLAGLAIFSIVFSYEMPPSAGASLMFQTLPLIFSELPGGIFFAAIFFFLLLMAALTSQISAMEPLICFLIDVKKWCRHKATVAVGAAVFLCATPLALSFGPWKGFEVFGKTLFDGVLFLCLNMLIPLGGLGAALLIGWRLRFKEATELFKEGVESIIIKRPLILSCFLLSIKFIAPTIIVLILLDAFGII